MVLLGPRRVGKTVLIGQILSEVKDSYLLLNGEDQSTTDLLMKRSVEHYKSILGQRRFLVIDEAQKIEGIGAILKLMVDSIPGLKVIVTGSSMYDLNHPLGEPLTGRKITFHLFPLAQMEYSEVETEAETNSRLEERMIFGSYPELLRYPGHDEKAEYLKELMRSYLFRDILSLEGLRNASRLQDLLRLLAYQVGSEVSNHELGLQLGMSKNTVERYLDLLSQVFVIYKLQGYSGNLRKEIRKKHKWYFTDNGIRNALIANFNPMGMRTDAGALWENYILSERVKYQSYTGITVNNFFWRTYDGQEIDLVEERGGKLHAFEFKWDSKKHTKIPEAFKRSYPGSEFRVVTGENYLSWIK